MTVVVVSGLHLTRGKVNLERQRRHHIPPDLRLRLVSNRGTGPEAITIPVKGPGICGGP